MDDQAPGAVRTARRKYASSKANERLNQLEKREGQKLKDGQRRMQREVDREAARADRREKSDQLGFRITEHEKAQIDAALCDLDLPKKNGKSVNRSRAENGKSVNSDVLTQMPETAKSPSQASELAPIGPKAPEAAPIVKPSLSTPIPEPIPTSTSKPVSTPSAPSTSKSKPRVKPLHPNPVIQAARDWRETNKEELRLPDIPKTHPGQRIHLGWKVLPTKAKLLRMHHTLRGMASMGSFHDAFSLNLSHKIELRAAKAANPRDFIFRALQRALDGAGVECHFFMIIEHAPVKSAEERFRRAAKGLDPARRLHVHGELACAPEDRAAITIALNKGAGTWDGPASEHQLKFKSNPDAGWLDGYITKDGDDYSCARELRAKAEADYEEVRPAMNRLIRLKTKKI